MRHRNARNRLGRDSSHRRAMMRNMATSLFRHEQVETTDAKAKELRPLAERLITLAKRGGLHARRQALAYLQDKDVTHRLFGELRDRYLARQGGYIRIVKKGIRRGDGAPVSIIQLLPEEKGKKERKSSVAKGALSGGGKKQGEAKPEKKAAERDKQQGRSGETVERDEGTTAKISD